MMNDDRHCKGQNAMICMYRATHIHTESWLESCDLTPILSSFHSQLESQWRLCAGDLTSLLCIIMIVQCLLIIFVYCGSTLSVF